MTDGRDRRVFPRRTFRADVFVYESGVRFRATPADLSFGGCFLATAEAEVPALDCVVSVVFDPVETGLSAPVYLFGRVVRLQPQQPRGFALAWEKAVSAVEPGEMASFLEGVFGLASRAASSMVRETSGRFRSLFAFPAARPASPAVDHLPRPSRTLLAGPVGTSDDPPIELARPGPITTQFESQGRRTRTRFEGILSIGGAFADVLVVEIEAASLVLSCRRALANSHAEVGLRFQVPVRELLINVNCRGRVAEWRPGHEPGELHVVLTITEIDGHAPTDELARYARWLYGAEAMTGLRS